MARPLDKKAKYEYEHLLGLAGTYDKKILKKAYLAQIREWHPDLAERNGHSADEASEMTKKINNAFVELSGILADASSTATCETSPDSYSAASASSTAYANASTGRTTTDSARSASGTGTRNTSHAGTHTKATEPHATAEPDWGYDTVEDTGAADTHARGAVPRNMAAAMRYTRIVTNTGYIKWFVDGIGPHIVFAVACAILLALVGLLMSGLYGIWGVVMMVRLTPIAIIWDIVTGKGAELVGSAADIWAVNKAVKSTK